MADAPSTEEIDALLAALGGDVGGHSDAKAPRADAGTNSEQLLAQPGGDSADDRGSSSAGSPSGNAADIDALLAQLSGAHKAERAAAETRDDAPPPAPGTSSAGVSDIDRLLAELSSAATPAGPETAALTTPGSAAPASAPRTTSAVTPNPTGEPGSAAAGTGSVRSPASTGTGSVSAPASGSKAGMATPDTKPILNLSTEEVDALVAKQGGKQDTRTSTGIIAQSDIDALLQQLTDSTPGPNEARQPAPAAADLAKHEGAIDKMLAQNAPAPGVTSDAVDVRQVLGIAPTPTPQPMAYPGLVPAAAPIELRGARWLLAAAVVALSICATTLSITVVRLGDLAGELRRTRVATSTVPTDSYAEDFATALARLASGDGDAVARGVMLLERLRQRHPAHAAEISLVLARTHRTQGDHGRAAAAFALAGEPGNPPFTDPGLHLDHADSLAQANDRAGALAVVYNVLAEEDSWVAERLPGGGSRSGAELVRNRQAVHRAYLMLGRLLEQPAPATVQREPAEHDHKHEPGHGPAEPAAGHDAGHAPAAHAAEHGHG
ncbi:hypothetical protein LBMAG53_10220 [Planctomycetota bacterium]|nr:hypothetical protein LBMAG53_10220 [Planctomycetota bacterium]